MITDNHSSSSTESKWALLVKFAIGFGVTVVGFGIGKIFCRLLKSRPVAHSSSKTEETAQVFDNHNAIEGTEDRDCTGASSGSSASFGFIDATLSGSEEQNPPEAVVSSLFDEIELASIADCGAHRWDIDTFFLPDDVDTIDNSTDAENVHSAAETYKDAHHPDQIANHGEDISFHSNNNANHIETAYRSTDSDSTDKSVDAYNAADNINNQRGNYSDGAVVADVSLISAGRSTNVNTATSNAVELEAVENHSTVGETALLDT